MIASLVHSLRKKMVSSANWRIDIFNLPLPTSAPKNSSFCSGSHIKPLKPFATTKKRSGASISPCLSPFVATNSYVGLPLTRIEVVDDCKQPQIQSIHLAQKIPIIEACRTKIPISQNHKSALKMKHNFFFALAPSITLFAISSPSNMFLPLKKADCL